MIEEYCENSKLTEKRLNELGQFAIACDCGKENCNGWAMISKENLKNHIKLYIHYDPKTSKRIEEIAKGIREKYETSISQKKRK